MRRLSGLVSAVVVLAAAMPFVALLALNAANWAYYANDAAGLAYHYGLPAACIVLLMAALRLQASWRAALAISLVSVVPCLYAVELVLTLSRSAVATADNRTKIQVIDDLRRSGLRAWPALRAKALIATMERNDAPNTDLRSPITTAKGEILPLASVPRATIVACNEAGRWQTYRSDAHGMRNSADVWRANPLVVALIGDSFVQGDCVSDEATIAAHLGATLGHTLNLGVSGAGPLSMLAALVEYAEPMRPKSIVWFFFEGNDIVKDLPVEVRSPILRRYLEVGFDQRLIDRSAEIATALEAYLETNLARAMAEVDDPNEALLDFLKLYRLREALGLDPVGLGLIDGDLESRLALFDRIISAARHRTEAWGGRFVFVYLPDSARYFASAQNSRIRDYLRIRVLTAVEAADIPLIDIHRVFAATGDPRALFRFPGSHYNEAGYRTVAEAVAKVLRHN